MMQRVSSAGSVNSSRSSHTDQLPPRPPRSASKESVSSFEKNKTAAGTSPVVSRRTGSKDSTGSQEQKKSPLLERRKNTMVWNALTVQRKPSIESTMPSTNSAHSSRQSLNSMVVANDHSHNGAGAAGGSCSTWSSERDGSNAGCALIVSTAPCSTPAFTNNKPPCLNKDSLDMLQEDLEWVRGTSDRTDNETAEWNLPICDKKKITRSIVPTEGANRMINSHHGLFSPHGLFERQPSPAESIALSSNASDSGRPRTPGASVGDRLMSHDEVYNTNTNFSRKTSRMSSSEMGRQFSKDSMSELERQVSRTSNDNMDRQVSKGSSYNSEGRAAQLKYSGSSSSLVSYNNEQDADQGNKPVPIPMLDGATMLQVAPVPRIYDLPPVSIPQVPSGEDLSSEDALAVRNKVLLALEEEKQNRRAARRSHTFQPKHGGNAKHGQDA